MKGGVPQTNGWWGLAAAVWLVWAAACGSINEMSVDGGSGTAGVSGTAGISGAAGTGGGAVGGTGGGAVGGTGGSAAGVGGTTAGGRGGSGSGGAAATGMAGAAGSISNPDGSVGKDGSGDATGTDALPSDCMPGDRRCDANTPLTCDASGNWQRGAACATMCVAGSCTGICQPGAKMCVGNIPQVCDNSGMWQSAPACTYVCRQGDCTGVCQPGARQCSSSGMPQSCNVDGAWDSGTACPFVCSQGACTGVCKPGTVGCNGDVPQRCTSAGDWQSGTACQFVCTNGACAGSCSPGARQCSNGVPQTCTSGGDWQDGTACPYLCTNGACTGSCAPGATRCANGTKQICDATGNWQDTTTPSMQILMNPGFDAGHVAWSESSLSTSTVITMDSALTSLKAHTPSYVAWLGGYSNAQDDLSQMVTIPAGASSITLTFYYVIQTQENTAPIYDTLQVYTYDPVSGKYTAVATLNDNMAVATWTRFTASLPLTLAGQTFELGFQATTDGSKNTNFFVDTVSLDVTACSP